MDQQTILQQTEAGIALQIGFLVMQQESQKVREAANMAEIARLKTENETLRMRVEGASA